MALNFDKIMTDSEHVSLEDLSFETFDQTDLDPDSITLNDLFEDRLSFFNQESNCIDDDITDPCLFDIDVDCTDLEKVWISDCDINDHFGDINLSDFEPNQSSISADTEDVYVGDTVSAIDSQSEESYTKNSTIIRRQSTRIQNQTRKKIADQIQRENIRLAVEAQFLNTNTYSRKSDNNSKVPPINGKPPITAPETSRALPTDLDAVEDYVSTDDVDILSDEDPNKLWCICRQPYGDRFMICCDNCLEWYHGDCVGVTQKEGTSMDEFICPPCVTNNSSTNTTIMKSEEIVIIDDDEEDEADEEVEGDDDQELLCTDDDDCLITKAIEPSKFNSNIFQLINRGQNFEPDNKPYSPEAPVINLSSLSSRTSVCLNQACKTLVNPKKSLYCSRNCLDKYTRMVIKNNHREKAKQYGLPKGPKLAKMTRFVLAQPATETVQDEFEAPTEENLKRFLLKNPTYKVYQSSKPVQTKQNEEKSKKFLELLNKDPSKHIKVVKHFATLFKKSMPLKTFNTEFRSIWQFCVKIEDGIFENFDKVINDKYMLKVKEVSECLKNQDIGKLCSDISHGKLSVVDLLWMNKHQLETRSKLIVLDDHTQTIISPEKQAAQKKTFVATRGGISLLADTTHLHGKHLYDIKCRICNGTSKTTAENITKEKESVAPPVQVPPPMENVISSCPEIVNLDDIPSPINNDEFKVTSSVATPDMAVDMEICSTPSEKDTTETNAVSDSKVDSSSKDVVRTSATIKPHKRKMLSLWEGDLTYKEVGTVSCKSYLVTRHFLDKSTAKEQEQLSDNKDGLRDEIDIGSSLDSQILINGRSQLSVVQDYLRKLRKHSNKEFLILRLHPTNLEEGRQTYLSMFEFFHSRERCGVVSHKRIGVKDCFIYPLNAHAKIPPIFLPFNGPGLEKSRPHLLLLLIVRTPLTHQYQPISPRYDEEHDIVKKHGINLDKYYQPNQKPLFCPSPIASSEDTGNSSKGNNTTTDSKVVKADTEIPKDESDKNNIGTIEIPEVVNVETDDRVVNKNDAPKISEIPKIDLLNIPLPPSLPDNNAKKPHKSVLPGDQPMATSSPDNNLIIKTLPPKLPIVVPQAVKQKPDTAIAAKQSEDGLVVDNEPLVEPSFTPQVFVYKSLSKTCSQTQDNSKKPLEGRLERKITHFIPESRDEKVEESNPSHIPVDKIIHEDDTQTPDISIFCQDNDFRFITPVVTVMETQEHNPDDQLIDTDSRNRFLKRKCSDRLYTFYDSFELEEDCQEKRLKYFFNPHNRPIVGEDRDEQCCPPSRSPSPPSPSPSPSPPPQTSRQQLPQQPPEGSVHLSVINEPVVCGGVALKKNMSIFIPPGDISKT